MIISVYLFQKSNFDLKTFLAYKNLMNLWKSLIIKNKVSGIVE